MSSDKGMKKILFVCTGNTCRSPMAQFVFNDIVSKRNLPFIASSAGIYANDSNLMNQYAQSQLLKKGISPEGFRPAKTSPELIKSMDYIYTLTESHRRNLVDIYPNESEKIFTLGDTVGGEDVYDPYGGDMSIYRDCFKQIYELVQALIDYLVKNHFETK